MKSMRALLLGGALLAVGVSLSAQPVSDDQGNVGIGTLNPDPGALLDLSSTTRGFLMPRMTTAQITALVSPAEGLMVFNTDLGLPQVWSDASGASQWDAVLTDGSNRGWLTSGNGGLVDGTSNMLGTLDGTPVRFISNNIERMRLTATGQLGVGTPTPGVECLVDVAGRINSSESYDVDGNPWLWDGPGGFNNTLVGPTFNTTNAGIANVFVGGGAGANNTSGSVNVFVGADAGAENTVGFGNTFVGSEAGSSNISGENNTFMGQASGQSTTDGDENVFIGSFSGTTNTTGTDNVFVGLRAGQNNTAGSGNSALGTWAGPSAASLENATAIGAYAQVAQDNALVLGSINGVNTATASTDVGIGTTTPGARLDVAADGMTDGLRVGTSTGGGRTGLQVANGAVAFSYGNLVAGDVDDAVVLASAPGAFALPAPPTIADGTTVWVVNNTGANVTVTDAFGNVRIVRNQHARQFLYIGAAGINGWVAVQSDVTD